MGATQDVKELGEKLKAYDLRKFVNKNFDHLYDRTNFIEFARHLRGKGLLQQYQYETCVAKSCDRDSNEKLYSFLCLKQQCPEILQALCESGNNHVYQHIREKLEEYSTNPPNQNEFNPNSSLMQNSSEQTSPEESPARSCPPPCSPNSRIIIWGSIVIILILTILAIEIWSILSSKSSASKKSNIQQEVANATSVILGSKESLLDVDFSTSEKIQTDVATMAVTNSSELVATHSTQSAFVRQTTGATKSLHTGSWSYLPIRCHLGTSLYESFGLPAPPGAPQCSIYDTDKLEPWDSDTTKLYHHYCPQQLCRFTTAVVSKYLNTNLFKKKAEKVTGLMVDVLDCSAWEIGVNQTVEFNSLQMFVLNFRKRQGCEHLNRTLSAWHMPALRFAVVKGVEISRSNEGYLNRLFNPANVNAVAIYNSSLCPSCKLFERKDLQALTTLYLYWSNAEEDFVVQSTKELMNGVGNVEHFGTNIPLTTGEFGRYMVGFKKLVTGNFTVEIYQRDGWANFPLSTTLSSRARYLEINLKVVNKIGAEIVVIKIKESSNAGHNLDCVSIHSPGNVIKLTESMPRENICWEYVNRVGQLSCCRVK